MSAIWAKKNEVGAYTEEHVNSGQYIEQPLHVTPLPDPD